MRPTVTSVPSLTAQRKRDTDESARRWFARAGRTLLLTASLGLAVLAPVAAPAVAGLAHNGQAAPIVAQARQLDPCPSGGSLC